jgi:hypothetical protein
MSGPDVTAPKKPPDQHLQAVQERLVARAQARRADAPGVFVRRYQYSAEQIPGWVVTRARTVEPTGRPGVLRLTQLTLAVADAPAELVKLDVYETPSPEAARELLLELLTGYQSLPGRVELADDVGDADVAFPGDGTRIFTRGNLVLLLVNAGGHARTVCELARSIDSFLMAPPAEAAPAAAAPAGRAAATAEASEASSASEAPGPSGAMTRYMVSRGTLRQEADGSIVAQEPAGRPVVSRFDAGRDGWQAEGGSRDDEPRAPQRRRPRRKNKKKS